MMTIYDFYVKNAKGEDISLSHYEGKICLIVNTASKCGFTSQYEELEHLYKKYKKDDFIVLAFPCNQFHNQEPEDNQTIQGFCQTTYGISFPVFQKIEVNGENAIPLYQFLTSQTTFSGFHKEHPLTEKLSEILLQDDSSYENHSSIKWNFTKFLIDRNGKIIARFEPTAPFEEIEAGIQELL